MHYNDQNNRIIITPGEPSGIGPDVVIMAIQKKWPIEIIICADTKLLLDRAKQINLPLTLTPYNNKNKPENYNSGQASILHIPLSNPAIPGQLDISNNNYIINTLNRAAQGCIKKEFSALITGPINKSIMHKGGISFYGHTEFLSAISGSKKTVMMLSNNKLRIALVTTHIPLSLVSQYITQTSLIDTIIILNQGLQKYLKIKHPKIYVCGLNPHSGECGYIGTEEINIIIPALNTLRKQKIDFDIIGPLPADTIFQDKYLQYADVILTMYHDQGLPVLKYSGFSKSVNITFGLPFIRTSVDHGSAIELSGKNIAQPNSMIMAINTAIKMIQNTHEQKILSST